MKLVLIAGLPGSGKTGLLRELAQTAEEQGLHVMSLDDPGVAAPLAPFLEAVGRQRPDLVVIADPAFCHSRSRELAEARLRQAWAPAQVEWHFFANDAEACRRNVVRRQDDRKVMAALTQWSKDYTVPEGHVALAVWVPKENAEAEGPEAMNNTK